MDNQQKEKTKQKEEEGEQQLARSVALILTALEQKLPKLEQIILLLAKDIEDLDQRILNLEQKKKRK